MPTVRRYGMPPSGPNYDPTGVEYYTITDLQFLNQTILPNVKIAYRQFQPTSGSSKGYVLIPTCFSGVINTTLTFTSSSTPECSSLSQYHVIVVAMLSNGESASPSNAPFFPNPGELHYEDCINAQYRLLTEGLGVKELEAVVGFSMGGQQAYHWAVMYPKFVKRIVGICTSARTSPHNYAFLEGPIAALTNSLDYIAYKEVKERLARGEDIGEHLKEVKPKRGLKAFARAYAAWLTSGEWFRQREWEKTLGCGSVEEWIAQREVSYEGIGWDADDLLGLARMWQMGDVGRTGKKELSTLGGGVGKDDELEAALRGIECKVLLMPCRTDQYFAVEDNEKEVQFLKDGKVVVIESSWGHVAGGGGCAEDVKFMDTKIADFLKE
ncbi:hypothetical protein H2198_005298 [Neophaeococcomyces mojaviensis]|uniref:Uncharacterized protein n=1 Tax=Neophaeococcomyces mojaviensis TaxID=3383035 RepID=A0ACC3A629_9EURO|nr:hypothetical protein H2198_005298 [Knufia sp. JES_112]